MTSESSLTDVLDRVLDKGVIIDARVCVSPAGIHLITVDARVVVASIETSLHHSAALPQSFMPYLPPRLPFDSPDVPPVPCPKCHSIDMVKLGVVLSLGTRHTHGHCVACGHAWVKPIEHREWD